MSVSKSDAPIAPHDALRSPTLAEQVTGPDAPRCSELHDFGELPDSIAQMKRPLTVVLVLAALFMIASNANAAPPASEIAQQSISAPG